MSDASFPLYYVNARLKEDALLLRGEVVLHVPRVTFEVEFRNITDADQTAVGGIIYK